MIKVNSCFKTNLFKKNSIKLYLTIYVFIFTKQWVIEFNDLKLICKLTKRLLLIGMFFRYNLLSLKLYNF